MLSTVVVTVFTALSSLSGAAAWPKRQTLSIDDIQTQALSNAYKVLDGTLSDGMTRSSGCNKNTVAVRKE